MCEEGGVRKLVATLPEVAPSSVHPLPLHLTFPSLSLEEPGAGETSSISEATHYHQVGERLTSIHPPTIFYSEKHAHTHTHTH